MNRISTMAALAAAGLITTGCQEYVFEPVVPALIAVNNNTYELADVRSADILFVIDDSGSMAGEQANLSANFDAFINAIEQENAERRANGDPEVDYRLAVTSTSINLTYDPGSGRVTQDTYNIPGGFDCRSAYNLSTGAPYPNGALLAAPGNQTILDSTQLDSAEIIRQFRQNVQLGICGSGQEQGLLAMRRALEQNPGFVRDQSRLVVAFLSDEEDCSDPNSDVVLSLSEDVCVAQAGMPQGGNLGPVGDYATFLRELSSSVVVGVIVSATGSPPNVTPAVCSDSACEAACTSGGDPRGSPCYCGGQSPGGRYIDLANAVGNGSPKDSICQTNFSETLRGLAEVIVTVDEIYLSARPFDDDPSLILLKILRDGEEIRCQSPQAGQTCSDPGVDWEYQLDNNGQPLIRLCNNAGSECRIQPGDRYKVSFVEVACSADNPC